MPQGSLEVLLVGAKDLEDNEFFGKMDCYVILSLRTQQKKSTVASGQGCTPEWNETFLFTVSSDDASELSLKIYDKDTLTADDFLGEATIPLATVFTERSIDPTKYNVVDENKEYRGHITVGLTFTCERTTSRDRSCGYGEDEHRAGRHGGSRSRHGNVVGETEGSDEEENSRRGGRGHNSSERYGAGDDSHSRRGGGHGNSRERGSDDDDESGRGRRGGRRESHEESYGGYKESLHRY